MRKSTRPWNGLLSKLGFRQRDRRNKWSGQKSRSLVLESLEQRQLLAIGPAHYAVANGVGHDGPGIIDDGEPGFTLWGDGWTEDTAEPGFQGDVAHHERGWTEDFATWEFDNLEPGQRYAVLATWAPGDDHSTRARYTVYDGKRVEGSTLVNQQRWIESLGSDELAGQVLGQFTIDTGTLTVMLSSDDYRPMTADSISVVPVANVSTGAWPIDDGDALVAEAGRGWLRTAWKGGYNGDIRYCQPGEGNNRTSWTLEGLQSGLSYEVYAAWPSSDSLWARSAWATNAPFSISDGDRLLDTVRINQQPTPGAALSADSSWTSLGVFRCDSGRLVVELSDDADGVVIADAVRAVRYSDGEEISSSSGAIGGLVMMAMGEGEGDQTATVVDRRLFYNNSAWDGNDPAANAADDAAIATSPEELTAMSENANLGKSSHKMRATTRARSQQ